MVQKGKKKPTLEMDKIKIQGGRVHNLKNIDLTLPHNKLIVVVGVSGSGKSSLVFDLIFAEARRRYMETLENNYVRHFIQSLEQADVDEISGLQAPIGIAQETNTNQNLRSTIGTLTDIYAYLRLLYARVGQAYSYLSGERMIEHSSTEIETRILTQFDGQVITLMAPLIKGRKGHYQELFTQLQKKQFEYVRINKVLTPLVPNMYLDRYKTHDIDLVLKRKIAVTAANHKLLKEHIALAMRYGQGNLMVEKEDGAFFYFSRALMDPKTGLAYSEPSPNTFSFNSKYGACPTCKGFGEIPTRSIAPFIVDEKMSIAEGAIAPLGAKKRSAIFDAIEQFLAPEGYSLETPIKKMPKALLREIIYGEGEGKNKIAQHVLGWLGKKWTKKQIAAFIAEQYERCPDCKGTRLTQEALHYRIGGKNIAEVSQMHFTALYDWLSHLLPQLSETEKKIATDLVKAMEKRVKILIDMGLYYLNLDRPLQTLSSGEVRRIRLATQIGTQERYLVGVMYILDEPSIGLHQRDNAKLLKALEALRDMNNTIIIIEHDKETMLAADYLVEVGPKAGEDGGQIVAAGKPKDFVKTKSITADFLLGHREIATPTKRRQGNGQEILLKGCTGHNLKKVDLRLPLGKLVVITGVSGSGKSTLINQTLLPLLKQKIAGTPAVALAHAQIEGIEGINKVIEIDQTPIGRTSRSNPATYTGLFTLIRDLFTLLPQSKIRGYKAGRFSFNVALGSCPECKGAGIKLVEMDFLPSIRVMCETCRGRRYDRETLQVQYKGKSIADVLEMTIHEALHFFADHHRIASYLQTLEDVGLGYIRLGQHALSLSGGEGQRVKIATELHKKSTGRTLYILDEPTTGLHFEDTAKLILLLERLVGKGNTVVVIEHNMDVIKMADHVIDLGPEAGEKGGQIIAEGTPEEVAQNPHSHTGRFLAEELKTTSPKKSNRKK